MKRLIFLLALCLCLNGLAVAEQAAPIEAPEAAQAQTGSEDPPPAVEGGGEADPNGEAASVAENVPVEGVNPEAGQSAEGAAQSDEGASPEAAANPEGGEAAEGAARPAEETPPQTAANPEAGETAESANAENQADAEVGTNSEAGADADIQASAETGENAGNHGNAEAAADAEAASNPDAGATPEAAADTGNQANPEAEANPEAMTNPEQAPASAGEVLPDAAEAAQAMPEDAEAWFERDGVKTGGKLEELVARLTGGETVYIRASRVLYLAQAPLKKLSGVKLLPDAEVFSDKKYEVRASREDPQDVEGAALTRLTELAACWDDETGPLYIWVAEAAEPEPDPEPEPIPEPVITVTAENFTPAAWSAAKPTFTLGGIPEGAKYTYAAIIYDERIIPLSGNVWTPEEEGVFTARFAMLDGIGDIVSASEKYTLWLDHTEPENVLVMPSSEVSYTMNIIAKDAMSGVAALSLDSGATWMPFANDQSYTYTGDHPEDFGPGSILVADVAGNVYVFQGEFRLEKIQPMPSYSGGGGGGGTSAKPKTHASGDGEETAEYDALELEVPAEPMKRLTVGGQSMDLTLTLESAQKSGAPVGETRPFTAKLLRWGVPAGGGTPDTLLLDARLDDVGDAYTYRWRFNGEVYRALANSDIKYVALKVGDNVAAFPTEGFTGGTKYTELKMLGVSTRRFDYALDMKVNLNPGYVSTLSDCDFSQACDLAIRTEVENMAYELSSSTHSVMYFYDVYLGPEDMLNKPFGQYAA